MMTPAMIGIRQSECWKKNILREIVDRNYIDLFLQFWRCGFSSLVMFTLWDGFQKTVILIVVCWN